MHTQVIILVLGFIVIILCIIQVFSWKLYFEQREKYEKEIKRYKSFYRLEELWRKMDKGEVNIFFFLQEYNINSIAIYGMGKYGVLLYNELKKNQIEVKYAIDRKYGQVRKLLPIKSLEDDLPPVDLVIVSVIYEYNDIAQKLREKLDCPIISLEQILTV